MFTEAYAVIPKGVMRDIVTSHLPFWDKMRMGHRPPVNRFCRDFLAVHRRSGPGRRQRTP